MNDDFLSNLTFTNLLGSLWRQKLNAIFFALVMFGLIVLALIFIPKKYESEGKLFVRLGRGGVTLDPTATTGETIMIQESRESEINSTLDFLRSRGVLNLVVKQKFDDTDEDSPTIGEKLTESGSLLSFIPSIPSFWSANESDFADGQTYDQLKSNDLAIEALHDCLIVKAPRKASSISVSCRTDSPKLSQKVVRALMDTYIEEHVKARQTDGSFNFFEDQFEAQKTLVAQASNKLSEFKNTIGVMDVGGRRAALRSKIAEIESKLIKTEADSAAAFSKSESIAKILSEEPDQVVVEETEGVANQGSDLMRDRLYTLQLQEKDLLSRFHADHPSVLAVRSQLEDAKKIMTTENRVRTMTKKGLNMNVEALKLDLMRAAVMVESSTSEKNLLEKKLKIAVAEMTQLNNDETKLAELQRYLDRAETNFHIYSEKREEARINLELDSKNISNVQDNSSTDFASKTC